MSSRSILFAIAAFRACSSLGCTANVMDLGNNGGPETLGGKIASNKSPDSGSTAGTVHRIVDRASAACVDNGGFQLTPFNVVGGRLYWLALSNSGDSILASLSNCNVDDCVGTYASSKAIEVSTSGCGPWSSPRVRPQIDGDSVFWSTRPSGPLKLFLTPDVPNADSLELPLPDDSYWAFEDSGRLYLRTSSVPLAVCDADNCPNSIEPFAMTPPPGVTPYQGGIALTQDADSLLLMEGYSMSNIPTRLLRVPKDVNATFAVIANGAGSDTFDSATMNATNVYWVEGVVLGQVKTCPIAGCSSTPEVLFGGLNRPSNVALDESQVYVLEPPRLVQIDELGALRIGQPGRILRCPILGCEQPEVLFTSTKEYAMDFLLVDDRFVYFSAAEGPNGPYYIAAIEK